ncbi:hypothetical protein [Kocuria varians]|uniref:hypothetical protein n=1 Tax=Kocuria varians TaxID=1272 RepID=UPI002164556A|nr:hypothetical protein [Kocuria varians]
MQLLTFEVPHLSEAALKTAGVLTRLWTTGLSARGSTYSPDMLYHQRPLLFGPEPTVITTLEAGGVASRVAKKPHMHQLARGLWVVRETPPSPMERAVLLQKHLGRPGARLAVGGVHGLELLQLPVGGTDPWIERLLGSTAPVSPAGLAAQRQRVHLFWRDARVQTRQEGIRIGASKGLALLPGPWSSAVAHPVESLAVISRDLAPWRITACLDALISTEFGCPGTAKRCVFPPERVQECLDQLPPRSYGAVRLRRAWEDARSPCWSPAETLTRLIAVRSGLPEPILNHEVEVAGQRFVLDLAWPGVGDGAGVALEYNGAVHAREVQQYRDEMHRLTLLRDAGWDVRVITWDDLKMPLRREMWLGHLKRVCG